MFYPILRRNITYHLLAGMMLGVVIASAVSLHNYKQSLLQTVDKFSILRANMLKMNRETEIIDMVMKKVNSLLPLEYSEKSHRELMLLTMDDIKANFPKGEVTIEKFEEHALDLLLPVTIVTPVDNWTSMVENIRRLQSLSFPDFMIKSVVIEKVDAKTANRMLTCKIEGRLSMPIERLK